MLVEMLMLIILLLVLLLLPELQKAEDLGETGYDIYYGHGLVDIEALLKEMEVSLEPITAKEKSSETSVSGFIEGLQPYEEKRLVIAGYQEDGDMLAIAIPEIYQADKIGVLNIKETFEKEIEAFSEIKLFWLMVDEFLPIPEKPFDQIRIVQ